MEKIKIADVKDIPNNKGIRLEIDDLDIAVIKINEEVFVINNLCPHQHAPVLFEGSIKDYVLSCPLHGWSFNLKTGETIYGQGKLKKLNYTIENGSIFLYK